MANLENVSVKIYMYKYEIEATKSLHFNYIYYINYLTFT